MKLTGLIAAPVTPMTATGEIRPEVIDSYAAYLVETGVSGVFVNGTTGESLALTVDERKKLAETWMGVKRSLKVIIHVGHNSLPAAVELAAHAEEIGADAVGAMPPMFLATDSDNLVAFLSSVAAAAPKLPFYYYNIPSLTGVNLRMRDLLPALAEKTPNLAGAKFTFEDVMDFQQCLDTGKYDMLFGRDEMFMSGVAAGAVGAVGSTYNYMAPVYLKIMAAMDEGDLETARQWQAKSHALVQILQESGNGCACGKAIMPLIGIDCGPSRCPQPYYDEAALAELKSKLDEIGFFGWYR